LVVILLVLVGCGTSEPEESNNIDIVGSWNRVGGDLVYVCQYSDDGTYICAASLDQVNRGVGFKGNFWFEDGNYFDQLTEDGICTEVGVYEIILLDNGNHRFELIEDDCSGRRLNLFGLFSNEGSLEWEPAS
jgi:hypothetical protein